MPDSSEDSLAEAFARVLRVATRLSFENRRRRRALERILAVSGRDSAAGTIAREALAGKG